MSDSATRVDREGNPIEIGSVCTFYSAVDGEATLRIKIVSLHPGSMNLVDGEILEILARRDGDIWRHEKVVTPPADLLVVERS